MKPRSRTSPPSSGRNDASLCHFPFSIVSALLIATSAAATDPDPRLLEAAGPATTAIEETRTSDPDAPARATSIAEALLGAAPDREEEGDRGIDPSR